MVEHPIEMLIVEDDPEVRQVLSELFGENGYQGLVAGDGEEGLEVFRSRRPPLVVTDLKMPKLDGVELVRRVKALDPDAAVVVLTGYGEVETAIETLKMGAADYITKPLNLDELLIAAERALERRRLTIENREHQETLERRVQEQTQELARALEATEGAYRETLEALGSALDTRDIGTQAHSKRVVAYARMLAEALGVTDPRLTDIERGVLLHDIGKIGIPDSILLKPGPLTPEEWTVMRTHPVLGRQLLSPIRFLQGAIPVVIHHHERWDGTGYPTGLRGEEIPLGARIFAIVDAFDAMTVDRPYSKAISPQAALEEIKRSAGTHLDPRLVEVFLSLPLERLEEVLRRAGSEGGGTEGKKALRSRVDPVELDRDRGKGGSGRAAEELQA